MIVIAAVLAYAVTAVDGCPSPLMVTPERNAPHGVHIRMLPKADAAIKDGLPHGARLLLEDACHFGKRNEWCAVRVKDGNVRYASAEYLRPVTEDEVDFNVRVLDVGSGQAAVITSGRSTVLIDGGADPNRLWQYLRSRSVSMPIGLIVVTSPSADHWRGLARIFAKVPVYHVWAPRCPDDIGECGAWQDAARLRKMLTRLQRRSPAAVCLVPGSCSWAKLDPTYQSGERIYLPAIPEIGVTLLKPMDRDYLLNRTKANVPCSYKKGMYSLVLRIDVAGARFLFTGDIVGKGEDEYGGLMSRYNEADLLRECSRASAEFQLNPQLLKSDVLIVPHHGDDTSSTTAFINAVHPTFALISTDERLRPTRESVLQRYKDAHAQVLTTSATPRPWNDNIVCRRNEDGKVACSYEDAIPPDE